MLSKGEAKRIADKAEQDMIAHLKEHPRDEWEISAWTNLANAGFIPNKEKKQKGLEKGGKK